MKNVNQLTQTIEVKRNGRSRTVPVASLSALVLSTSALAAEGDIAYPTIDFSAIPMGVWIAAVMAFVLMCGMAFIGLSALISVLRKSRGAVR
ncbi:hypothetical protein [Acinetobacter bereziniae]|uniref:hypothetical protein n=1 Tax=Acinetobacter bereziniae TaxID=106648 RepID=UPI000EF7453B|nr:hypothetical protein [Acinetobacter bereziniae]